LFKQTQQRIFRHYYVLVNCLYLPMVSWRQLLEPSMNETLSELDTLTNCRTVCRTLLQNVLLCLLTNLKPTALPLVYYC